MPAGSLSFARILSFAGKNVLAEMGIVASLTFSPYYQAYTCELCYVLFGRRFISGGLAGVGALLLTHPLERPFGR